MYRLRRVSTAIGLVIKVQLKTAKTFPISKPRIMSIVFAPKATKVAPMTNSVAATCSAAYKPAK
ncbi:hypothetical protein N9848_05930 [Flavobacteriaceae bacterium]|nr:hypothetical protein [Flavobacteriaceae bacterium]